MAGPLELVGVQAVVQGIAAFERDAANVNRLLTQINATTIGLGSQSTTAWGLVQSSSTAALTAVTTGASLAVGALTALTSATVGAAAGFENNLLKAGVAADLTAKQIDSLGVTVIQVASDTSVGISSIEQAANQLARSGITITDIQNGVLESTTKLSEASGGELGLSESAKLVSVAMNAWELSAKDVASVTNTLLGAANSSAIGFTDLSTSFQLSAPLAASLHISFQDLATAIAELGLAGVKGTVAGTALKTMLERLANPTKLASELMSKYGISIQDAAGNIVPLPEIIKRLENALGTQAVATHKLTDAQREQIAGSLFGTRAVLDALALADKGTETFDKLADTIRKTNVEEFAARMRQTLIPQLGVLRNQLESVVIEIGIPLEKALSDGVTNINKLLRTLDPAVPKAFGDALLAIFSVGGGQGLGTEITNAFGPKLGQAINGILDIIFAVRDAITSSLIPAFRILFASVTSGIDVTGGLGTTFTTIATTIRTVADSVARAVVVFSQFVVQLRSAADSSRFISTALTALFAAPFVGLALSLLRVAVAFASIGIQVAIISVAFAGMAEIVRRLGTTFDGSFASIVDGVRKLPPELQILLAVVLGVATAVGVNLAFSAFGALNKQIAILNAPLARLVQNLINMAGAIESNVLPALGRFLLSVTVATVRIAIMGITAAIVGVEQFGLLVTGALAAIPALGALAVAAGPLIVGIAAIALVAGAVYLAISTNFLGIRDAIVNSVGPAVAILKDVFLVQLGLMIVAVNFTISAVKSAALAISSLIPSAKDVQTAIISLIGWLTGLVSAVDTTGKSTLGLSGVFDGAFKAIADIVGPVIQFVIDRLNDFFTTIGTIPVVRDALNQLGVTFLSLRDTGAGALNQLQQVAATQLRNAEVAFQSWSTTAGTAADIAKTAAINFVNSLAQSMGLAGALLQQNSDEWAQWALNVQIAAGIGGKASPAFGTDVIGGILGAAPPAVDVGSPSFGSPTPLSAGGGKAAKQSVDELAAAYVKLLAGIHGNTQELAKFLAQLEQATPGRITGMISALQSMKGTISEIADQYRRVLVVQLAISTVQKDLDAQQANLDNLHLANLQATFGLQTQILNLTSQRLAVEAQIAVIDAQIAAIDAKELPIKQQIADIDSKISDAQRVDYGNALSTAQLNLQELPIKQQIAALATDINRIEDKRVTLLQRQQEILASQKVDSLNNQLKKTNEDLGKAWQTLNVPQILALEAQKNSLTDSITSAQDNLDAVQAQQKTTQETNELATIQIKLQQVALEDLLKPLDDQLTALQNIKDLQDAKNAVTIAGLNLEKQKLEDLLKPYEEERKRLEALKGPLQAQLDSINAQTAAIQNQIDTINNQFALQAQQFEAKKLQDQVELANLKIIKDQEDARYAALVKDYIDAAVQSGAFSASEALETIKRLGYWDESAAAIENIVTKFGDLQSAALAATKVIEDIPRDITINVHFNTPPLPSFQYGGVVGGPVGSPQLVIAHGGEHFLGVGNRSSSTLSMGTKSASGPAVVNNYTVNASYANKQSPANIGMDLRALIAMSKH